MRECIPSVLDREVGAYVPVSISSSHMAIPFVWEIRTLSALRVKVILQLKRRPVFASRLRKYFSTYLLSGLILDDSTSNAQFYCIKQNVMEFAKIDDQHCREMSIASR